MKTPASRRQIFAIVDDCLLKTRKARANRFQAVRLRRMPPEGHENGSEIGVRPRRAINRRARLHCNNPVLRGGAGDQITISKLPKNQHRL
jgi:hypothetical protein